MTIEQLDIEIEALKKQMEQALALHYKSAGALQFAEHLKQRLLEQTDG